MAHTFAKLVFAGVALVAGSEAVASAQPRALPQPQVEILVNGSPQKRYSHKGRWYVEALKGHEYAIRLRNPYAVRVAVALSVDGLNTIDARHTDASDARKWVLGPFETITISGWQTSRTDARRFEFTTEAQSYGQALGKADNLGVISAVFFRERAAIYTRDLNETTASGAPAAPPAAATAQRRDESSNAASVGSAKE